MVASFTLRAINGIRSSSSLSRSFILPRLISRLHQGRLNQRRGSTSSKTSLTMPYYPESPFTRDGELRQHQMSSLSKSSLIKDEDDFKKLERWLTKPPKYTTVRFNSLKLDQDTAIALLTQILSERCERFPVESLGIARHPKLHDLLIVTNDSSNRLESLEPKGKEVIVDLRCGQSVLRGAQIYAGGIIGAPASLRRSDNVSVYVDIEGKCLKGWKRSYRGGKVFIGNGVALLARREIFCDNPPIGVGIRLTECFYSAPSLYGNMGNQFYPQNLPSVVAVHVLDVQPGQTVLDMCAAPGGKTTHIASLMKLQGTLIACDVNKYRIEKLRETLERWQMNQFVQVVRHDCTLPVTVKPRDGCGGDEDCLEPPFQEETFDRVLLDTPCSGLGQRPQLFSGMALKSFLSYPKIQARLIKNAVRLLKVDGVLVYSTCSFSIDENEKVISQVLQDFPEVQLDEQKPYFGRGGLEGDHGMNKDQLRLLQRFIGIDGRDTPEDDTIGFFIAKLRKIRSITPELHLS